MNRFLKQLLICSNPGPPLAAMLTCVCSQKNTGSHKQEKRMFHQEGVSPGQQGQVRIIFFQFSHPVFSRLEHRFAVAERAARSWWSDAENERSVLKLNSWMMSRLINLFLILCVYLNNPNQLEELQLATLLPDQSGRSLSAMIHLSLERSHMRRNFNISSLFKCLQLCFLCSFHISIPPKNTIILCEYICFYSLLPLTFIKSDYDDFPSIWGGKGVPHDPIAYISGFSVKYRLLTTVAEEEFE